MHRKVVAPLGKMSYSLLSIAPDREVTVESLRKIRELFGDGQRQIVKLGKGDIHWLRRFLASLIARSP